MGEQWHGHGSGVGREGTSTFLGIKSQTRQKGGGEVHDIDFSQDREPPPPPPRDYATVIN